MRRAPRRRALTAAILAALALALAPGALAHARLVRTEPEAGAVLSSPPSRVVLAFDDAVRPAGGTAVIRNGGGSVLAGKPRLAAGDRLVVLPLAPLQRGDYTVRWRVITDDGHLLSGVFAFAVGAGRPAPTPALSAGGDSRLPFRVARWVFLAGLLAAAGTVGWVLLVRRQALGAEDDPAVDRLDAAERVTLAVALAVAAAGLTAALLIEPDAVATRFGRASQAGIVLAVVGALSAALSLALRPLVVSGALAALGLLVTEALSGHALDPGQPRALAAPLAVLHLAAVSFWAGGLLWLAVLAPLTLKVVAPGERARALGRLARRFSFPAVVAVAVLATTGVARAWTELSAVDQLWTTGYGKALLAKTAIFAALLALGWVNRRRLLPRLASNPGSGGTGVLARLRQNVSMELVLIGLALVAVSALLDLRPGRAVEAARSTTGPTSSGPVVLPPRGALVLAGQADDLAVALATEAEGRRLRLQANVVGSNGDGFSGLDVGFRIRTTAGESTARATPCGSGCYEARVAAGGHPRSVAVSVARGSGPPGVVRFALPETWPAPSAAALVADADRAFRSLRSVVIRERLASSAQNVIETTWELAAPNRFSYRIDGGPEAVVIGDRRWDRSPGGPWVASTATARLRQPQPFWGDDRLTNARLLGESRVGKNPVLVASFLDRRVPAWFTAWIDKDSLRLLRLRMTAAAHFMRHRYSDFDSAPEIRPPRAG